jgi:hypothetical protein
VALQTKFAQVVLVLSFVTAMSRSGILVRNIRAGGTIGESRRSDCLRQSSWVDSPPRILAEDRLLRRHLRSRMRTHRDARGSTLNNEVVCQDFVSWP